MDACWMWPGRCGSASSTSHPAVPSEAVRGGLSKHLDARWFTSGRDSRNVRTKFQQQLCVSIELAMRYQNPVALMSALKSLAAPGRGRPVADPAVPSLCDVELRDRGRAGQEGFCGWRRHRRIASSCPLLPGPRLHRGAGRQRPGVSRQRVTTICCSVSMACPSAISANPTPPAAIAWPHPTAAKHQPAHATCYRAQCYKTVAAFVEKAGLTKYSSLVPVALGPGSVAQALYRLRSLRFAQKGSRSSW